jgi:ABC-type transport system involved in multi-copper enzyme maturation permease subunit
MNALREVGLVTQRELTKNVRSAKGLALAILSILGGGAVSVVLVKIQEFAAKKLLAGVSAEQFHEFRAENLAELYGDRATGQHLADAPLLLYVVLKVCVWLTPLLIALTGFDAVAADLQYRTVRYWTVRVRRPSLLTGKFFGLWTVVSAITLVFHLTMAIVCIVRADAGATQAIAWGAYFWLVSLPISAAWCGLATLVGTFFRLPFLALLAICGTFFVLFIAFLIGNAANWPWLEGIYPNYWDTWLLSPRPDRASVGLLVCLGYAGAAVAGASQVFRMRDM